MHTYKIGFWNYEKMGVIGAEKAAGDWKDAGFNLAMTFEYDSQKNRPEEMIELLDECEKRGIRAIVCDSRTRFFHYLEAGREKFCEDAAAAVKQFGGLAVAVGNHLTGIAALEDPGRPQRYQYDVCRMQRLCSRIDCFVQPRKCLFGGCVGEFAVKIVVEPSPVGVVQFVG